MINYITLPKYNIEIEHESFVRLIEMIKYTGVYRSTKYDFGLCYHWHIEILGVKISMKKYERESTLTVQRFIVDGRDWTIFCDWKHGEGNYVNGTKNRNYIVAMGAFGHMAIEHVMNYENFKRDWALIKLFTG
jgi:hypothetical protein